MDKEDGRKLTRQAQYERRKQAARLHKRGMGIEDIAAALSMGHVTVRAAIKAFNLENAVDRSQPAGNRDGC